jgi:hypothetical protein
MTPLDRVRDRVPIEGGHGTRSQTDGSTVSGTQWDTVGHSHDCIQDELSRRFHAQIEAAKAKLAAKRRQRQEKKRKRDAGLRLRHASKMRRINP